MTPPRRRQKVCNCKHRVEWAEASAYEGAKVGTLTIGFCVIGYMNKGRAERIARALGTKLEVN